MRIASLNSVTLSMVVLLTSAAGAAAEPATVSAARPLDERVFEHDVRSPYQKDVTAIRVLVPKNLDPARRYAVVYVLPVEAKDEKRFGDPVAEVKKADLANRFQVICVAPTFSHLPWYADHPTDPTIRQESHFLKVVLPFVEKQYPARADPEGRLLLGFSKSGWGAFSLLLRYPDLFGRAVAWDAPLMMDQPGKYGSGPVFGTAENFRQYQVTELLKRRSKDQKLNRRLILAGHTNFQEEHRRFHTLLQSLKIEHAFVEESGRKHEWGSGWLTKAMELLQPPAPVERTR